MRDPARIPGTLAKLTQRYKMSVTEAGEVPCPCGDSKGRPMKGIGFKQWYWFANRTTRPNNKKEFIDAVKAARILRAAHFEEKGAEDAAEKLAKATVVDEDAKHATVTCRDCGLVVRVSRHILDRRSERCSECGGRFEFNDTSIVDDWLSMREATQASGLCDHTIRSLIADDKIVANKIRGRWYIGKSSLDRAVSLKRQHEEMSLHLPFGDFRTGNICPHCKKVFRNPDAMRLHIKQRHEEF